jgi:hypothetical protein
MAHTLLALTTRGDQIGQLVLHSMSVHRFGMDSAEPHIQRVQCRAARPEQWDPVFRFAVRLTV